MCILLLSDQVSRLLQIFLMEAAFFFCVVSLPPLSLKLITFNKILKCSPNIQPRLVSVMHSVLHTRSDLFTKLPFCPPVFVIIQWLPWEPKT